jgi:hypothetical protein
MGFMLILGRENAIEGIGVRFPDSPLNISLNSCPLRHRDGRELGF